MENDLKSRAEAFVPTDTENKGMAGKAAGIVMKSGLEPFGEKQNQFNAQAAEVIEGLESRCAGLEDKLRKYAEAMIAMKKEFDKVRLRSTLNAKQLEKLGIAMDVQDRKIGGCMLAVKPEARLEGKIKGCKEISGGVYSGIGERVDAIKRCTAEEAAPKLAELGKYACSMTLKELSRTGWGGKGLIAVVCFNLSKVGNIDALKTYAEIAKGSVYNSVMISAEDSLGEPQASRNISYIPSSALKVRLDALNPDLCIVCTDNIFDLIGFERVFTGYDCIVRLGGENPVGELDRSTLGELRYLNDTGMHHYIPLTAQAEQELSERSFKTISGDIVSLAEKYAENKLSGHLISLSKWENAVALKGRKLAIGYGDIKAACLEKAEDLTPPESCIEEMEKAAIRAIVKDYFGNADLCELDADWDYFEREDRGLYSVAVCFKNIKHFTYSARKNMYKKIQSNMTSEGLFIFNAPNIRVCSRIKDWARSEIFEAAWLKEDIVKELEDNGFNVRYIVPVGEGLYGTLSADVRNEPAGWTIAVSKS